VWHRRSWRSVDFWKSDSSLTFGPLAYDPEIKKYRRSEYLYLGRTTKGSVKINSISVKGAHARYFTVRRTGGNPIKANKHMRVQVTFNGGKKIKSMEKIRAHLEVKNSVTGTEKITINA